MIIKSLQSHTHCTTAIAMHLRNPMNSIFPAYTLGFQLLAVATTQSVRGDHHWSPACGGKSTTTAYMHTFHNYSTVADQKLYGAFAQIYLSSHVKLGGCVRDDHVLMKIIIIIDHHRCGRLQWIRFSISTLYNSPRKRYYLRKSAIPCK